MSKTQTTATGFDDILDALLHIQYDTHCDECVACFEASDGRLGCFEHFEVSN